VLQITSFANVGSISFLPLGFFCLSTVFFLPLAPDSPFIQSVFFCFCLFRFNLIEKNEEKNRLFQGKKSGPKLKNRQKWRRKAPSCCFCSCCYPLSKEVLSDFLLGTCCWRCDYAIIVHWLVYLENSEFLLFLWVFFFFLYSCFK